MTFFGECFREKGFLFMKSKTLIYARAGIMAGLYIVLTLLTLPLSSGAVQIRVSEILTLLPLIYVEAIPALFVGCLLSNFIAGCALFDVVLGALITLMSAVLSCIVGKFIKSKPIKIIVGGLFPVILNAFILPLIWLLCYGANEYVYIVQALIILAGQSVAVYALGAPVYLSIEKFQASKKK